MITDVREVAAAEAHQAGRKRGQDSPNARRLAGRWWNAPSASLAAELTTAASMVERWSWNRRWLNMVCQRYITGRDVQASYNFAMVRRPSALTRLRNATWNPPNYNGIATCADVYSARVWKNRPFVQVLPLAAGGFKARVRCKKLTKAADAIFDETKFWNTLEEVGIDCMTNGMGVVKVHEDQNQKRHVAISRVHVDELLVSEEEALYHEPHSMIQRAFYHREDLLALYPEHREAIRKATSVFPAFYWGGDLNYRDIVPLLEGWSKPTPDGQPGRHVLAIPGHVLLDEKYDRRFFPFALVRFKQLTGSWFAQGLAEQLLGMQAEINRLMAAMQECHERMGWPRVAVEDSSNVHVEELAGVPGGAYHYTGTAPQWNTPASVHPELYQHLERLIGLQQKRARISETALAGEKPKGINSGVGLMAWAQIDDAAHVDLMQRVEDFVTDVARLCFVVAEDCKPKFVVPGRHGEVIDWNDARLAFDPKDLTSSAFRVRAFPMSRLPQTIAAREQVVNDWLLQGQISRQEAMRLQQLPDTEGYANLATAALDDIEHSLDQLVEDGEWVPPLPFMDLTQALAMAQSRYAYERTLDTPDDRLELLLTWMICVGDLIDDLNPSAPAAAPGAAPGAGAPAPGGPAPFGIQPPTAPPPIPTPAASPMQAAA